MGDGKEGRKHLRAAIASEARAIGVAGLPAAAAAFSLIEFTVISVIILVEPSAAALEGRHGPR